MEALDPPPPSPGEALQRGPLPRMSGGATPSQNVAVNKPRKLFSGDGLVCTVFATRVTVHCSTYILWWCHQIQYLHFTMEIFINKHVNPSSLLSPAM